MCIQYLYYYKGRKMSPQVKLDFFNSTSKGYGKTALCLSGGAGLGKFHLGIIKALAEQDLMPRIICGSSAGSIIGLRICSLRYDELRHLENFEMTFSK